MLVGSVVEWSEDLRPLPDQVPAYYLDACFDPDLVVVKRGTVQSVGRTFWGDWVALVQTKSGLCEVSVERLKKDAEAV